MREARNQHTGEKWYGREIPVRKKELDNELLNFGKNKCSHKYSGENLKIIERRSIAAGDENKECREEIKLTAPNSTDSPNRRVTTPCRDMATRQGNAQRKSSLSPSRPLPLHSGRQRQRRRGGEGASGSLGR
jgi:hypothetical protein